RVFVAAKDGRIWILQGQTVVATPLLDLRELVSKGGEQGLLGLAVHPEFPADPRVFVDYTDKSGDTVVASYRLAVDDPDRLDASTEKRILEVDQPHSRHNGGALAFGPDGMLYIALGDGGGAGDQAGNAQRTDTLLGKVLRIDVNVPAGTVPPYAIPAGNPFAGSNSARQEIWLLGLRNAWRMSFDRSTGALWIGDVGQGAWEEIDVAGPGLGGLNFGWRVREGRHCYAPSSGCDSTGLTDPVSEYGHDLGCTVIGGAVYRGSAQPLLIGGYLFADYCSGRLWTIAAAGSGYREPILVGTTGGGIAAFGEDSMGELFAANLDGTISLVVVTAR
ncbi:MAG: PQQ-dependent sugar dehydrogenase, partial [Candidatus Limnocylindrales bacterium]